MRVNFGTVLILAIVAALALAVAGCGGGDSAAARTSGCKRLGEAAQKFSTFATGRDPDPETFVKEFDDFGVFSFLTIVSKPPEEIRDDLQVLDKAFWKYVNAIGDTDIDLANLDQEALAKLQKPKPWNQIDQQKIQQASQNITAWTRENC
jgi:hypothetical protein